MSLFAAIGYIVYDYYNLKGTASQLQNRDRHISNQMDEIRHQRRQIQEFLGDLIALKANLVKFNSF